METALMRWLLAWLMVAAVHSMGYTEPLKITRHNNGDIFLTVSKNSEGCTEDTCIGISSGTAAAISGDDLCTCRCHSHLPAFREDSRICVDDINECALAPFVGGSTSVQIPFVFLPLLGQIIYPSKEISFRGIQKPVCAVSGAKFLTEAGWVDLRNPVDTDVPFRLFRDEGKTFLQWVGESELRTRMTGRMVMVQLMCRELEEVEQKVFAPCVAFRVVGTPSRALTNVTEVAFSLEAYTDSESSKRDGLSVTEYVAIGVCSVLLGLIYVASIFLYLHLKKRNSAGKSDDARDSDSIGAVEEGVIKNNPLLSMTHHFGPADNAYSDTNSSDNENAPDLLQSHDVTSVMIHSQHRSRNRSKNEDYPMQSDCYQENSSFERIPEENVSIVETLDDRPDNIKALAGTIRKKLYFNPAYFEPHLLLAPPPAALEFLAKIREVIAIAKQKMSVKKFTPTLLNIPEEDTNYSVDPTLDFSRPSSRRGSMISLKRENSRRKSCTGCPGCEPHDFKAIRLPQFSALAACHNCTSSSESKQYSIRKWLEDIPVLRVDDHNTALSSQVKSTKRIRSPTRSLPPDSMAPERAMSPRPVSECGAIKSQIFKTTKKVCKPNAPPPPTPMEGYYDVVPIEARSNLPPPDMIQQAMELESQEITRIPTLTKKQMNAVINELTVHKNMLEAANRELARRANAGYETDSLERNNKHRGSTPSESTGVPSSQASPSLSTALPCEEEITMQNAILNKQTGNMTISKLNMGLLNEGDDMDYEMVVLRSRDIQKFPEFLKQNEDGDYSLVSEVYVNNGYNYGSNPSTPAGSNCSTLERTDLKIRYDGGLEKPGKLLIEVEDCLDHYIPVNDSDEFDPDTLDRPNKNEKLSLPNEESTLSYNNNTVECTNHILLRSKGSFKGNNTFDINSNDKQISNFNRAFGSLREMYEEKRKQQKEREHLSLESVETDVEGKLLTLEDRHSKRQRIKTTSSGPIVPPDLIPPPPRNVTSLYEYPNPPRKFLNNDDNNNNTEEDSKNEFGRSVEYNTPDKSLRNGLHLGLALKKCTNNQLIFHSTIETTLMDHNEKVLMRNESGRNWKNTLRPEDSGYLSTDSYESKLHSLDTKIDANGSETDDSTCDAHSESGAESVETHSVFFGRIQRKSEEGHSSSDSETVSYTTVVPVSSRKGKSIR